MELDLTTHTTHLFLYPAGQVRDFENEARTTAAAPGPSLRSLPSSSRTSPSSSIAHLILQDDGDSKDEQGDSNSAVLLVTVHLTVPPKATQPKIIQALVVTVKAIETLSFPRGRYEPGEPFNTTVLVTQAAETVLQAGSVHRWEIAIPVPHTAPPYERARHGSVRQRISAKVVFSGWMNKSLSIEKSIAFIALPTKEPTESFSWSRTHAASTGHLGPLFIALRTQHLTVGGFFRVALVLSEPKPSLSLNSFTITIVQQPRVRSRKEPKIMETSVPTYTEFFKATQADLTLLPNQPADKSWIARLPSCDEIRPSTIFGSEAAVSMAHSIQVHLSFYDRPFPSETLDPKELDAQGRRLYHYRVKWSITLPSCTLRWRSFSLPAYSTLDADPVPANPRQYLPCESGENKKFCTCGDDLKNLISYECEAESDLFTSKMLQDDIKRFRLMSMQCSPSEQPISGGVGFSSESIEGHVMEETEEESKRRLQNEKEVHEYAAVEEGGGEVRLVQGWQ